MRALILSTVAIIGAASAITNPGPTTHILASYSQHRPAKHEFLRPLLPESFTRAFKSRRFSSDMRRQEQESVIGGAVLQAPGIRSVAGTFTVPEARQPTDGPTGNNPITYAASFWVGIDGGVSCATASLRGGVDIFWDPEGTSYNVWYQWAPDRSADFADVGAAPGDVVRVTATAAAAGNCTSNGEASAANTVTVENLSSGKTATHTFTEVPAPLCRSEAVWAIHDFVLESGPGLPVPLANFSDVTFADVRATNAGGVVALDGAVVLNINQEPQGGRLTDCRREGDDVTCRRVVGN